MPETVTLYPAVDDTGRLVYTVPPRLTAQAKGAWVIALIVLAALALPALVGKEPRP